MAEFKYGTHPTRWEDVKICTYACCGNDVKFIENWVNNLWNNGHGSDYICVLDTGSEDGSYDKLLEMRTALNIPEDRFIIEREVIRPWRFDVGRNASMRLLPPPDKIDVCFCIDPDELVIEDFWNDLRQVVFEHPNFFRIHYQYGWSHDNVSGVPKWIFWYDKVHGVTGHKWYGAVHEACECRDPYNYGFEGIYKMSPDKIYLHHYPDQTKSRGYYLELLETRVRENEEDALGLYYLAREYSLNEMWVKLLEVGYKLYVKMLKPNPTPYEASTRQDQFVVPSICVLMGEAWTHLGNYNQAQVWFQRCIDTNDQYIEGYIRMMELCCVTNQIELGLNTLYKMKYICGRNDDWRIRPYMWRTWKQKHLEAVLFDLANSPYMAQKAFETALTDILTVEDKEEAESAGLYRDIETFNRKHNPDLYKDQGSVNQ